MSLTLGSAATAIGIIDKAVSITKKLSDNSPDYDKAALKLLDKIAFTFSSGVYWKEGDETAFCPKCWESDNKKIHLLSRERAYAGLGGFIDKSNWYCQVCKTTFDR